MPAISTRTGILGFLFMATASIVRGIATFPSVTPYPAPAITELGQHGLPLVVWAVFWCASGVMLFASVIFPSHFYSDLTILWTIGLYLAWGVAYLASYLFTVTHRGQSIDYVLGVQYIAIAVLGFSAWVYWVGSRKQVRWLAQVSK